MAVSSETHRVVEISFRVFLHQIMKKWWLLGAAGVLGMLLGIGAVMITPITYTAEAVLADGSSSGSGSAGGLAALSGINLRSSGMNKFTALVRSAETAERLAKDDRFMHILFGRRWHRTATGWAGTLTLRQTIKKKIYDLFGIPIHFEPGVDAIMVYTGRLKPNKTELSRTLTYSLNGGKPDDAFYLLNSILEAAEAVNEEREEARVLVRQHMLNDEVQKTQNVLLRQQLTEMYARELLKFADAKSKANSLVDVISISASDNPTTPKPLLIIAIATLSGIAIALGYILVMHSSNGDR